MTSMAALAFGLHDAPVLLACTLPGADMSITEIRCDRPDFGTTRSMGYQDAYLVALQVRACPDYELYVDGAPVAVTPIVSGGTMLHDLRRDPIAVLRSPFHSLYFQLTRDALDRVADDAGVPRVVSLDFLPGRCIDDVTVRRLLGCLEPFLEQPEQACTAFVGYVALALAAHIAHTYGGLRPARHLPRGGLSRSHEYRAKELLRQNLDRDVSLESLASECGLSVSHFSRAFRQSTGVPPHRWLLQQRVARAQELLRKSKPSLVEIALACGFANQSHFTRVFTALIGASPGAWRRTQT